VTESSWAISSPLAAIFLWFGVALTFLKVVGMGDIAASLGTAVGFIALGISYALSEMIEDTVAGVYLLPTPTSPGVPRRSEGRDRDSRCDRTPKDPDRHRHR